MVKVDESCILRFKKEGETIETLVDFKLLLQFREEKNSNILIYDIFADTRLFSDSKNGLEVSNDVIEKLFQEKSEEEILTILIREGEPQIPTAYLNELRKRKKKQIVEFISANAINPQTKGKYTPNMIKTEIDNLKISIDPNSDHINQAEQALKDLKKKMPISMEKSIIILQVEAQYSGNFYGEFRKLGTITKEYYDDSGNLHLHIEVLSGKVDSVISYIKQKSENTASYHIQKD